MRSFARYILLFALSFTLIACSNGGGSGANDTDGNADGLGQGDDALNFDISSSDGSGDNTDAVINLAPNENTVSGTLAKDTPFAYVQRKPQGDITSDIEHSMSQMHDYEKTPLNISSPYSVYFGARLFVRSGFDVNASDTGILAQYFQSESYDVKDINVSPNGEKLVFAAHGPENNASHSTWSIYEYDFSTGAIRRVIADDATANAGHDTSPSYAFDGTIVFSSDRSAGNPNNPDAVWPEEGSRCVKVKPEQNPSLLHSMSYYGEDIVQLTYGNNIDTNTTTMKDGSIAFLRWSRQYEPAPQCSASNNAMTLPSEGYPVGLSKPTSWPAEAECDFAINTADGPMLLRSQYSVLRINADGSDLEQLYQTVEVGASDEAFLSVSKLVQGENGQLAAMLAHRYNPIDGGTLIELQAPNQATENTVFGQIAPKPLTKTSADLYPNQLSENGWFSALWPYRDGSSRYLISWSQCAVQNEGVSEFCEPGAMGETASRYGIWAYDPATDTRVPIVRTTMDTVFSELAIAQQHSGASFPFAPFDANFQDDADLSTLVCPPNTPPVADAGPDQTADTRMGSTPLDGSNSSDIDNDPLTYSWTIVEMPDGATASLSDANAVMPTLEFAGYGDYVIQLIVNDGQADSLPDLVKITPENAAPIANAGPDRSAFVEDVVTLDGSGSSDPNGDAINYQWEIVQRPDGSTATLVNPNSVNPELTTDAEGEFVIQLIVNDGLLFSAPDQMVLTTEYRNEAPVAVAGNDVEVPKKTLVPLDGSGSFDPNNDPLVYSWTIASAPAGSTAVLVNPMSVTPSITPDIEGIYVVQLIVSDGELTSLPDTLTINALNAPPIADAGPDQTIDTQSGSVTLDGSGSSDPDNDPLTYTWTVIQTPDGATASLTNPNAVMPGLEFSGYGDYVVQLVVNDGVTDSAPDTVVIAAVNDRPVAVAGVDVEATKNTSVPLDGSASFDPNDDPLTYIWTIASAPAGSTAVLINPESVTPSITPDIDGIYVIELVVNDGNLDSLPDTLTITALNTPPIADAGVDQIINAIEPLQLDGSGSSDPDGDPLTYIWTVIETPDGQTATLSDPTVVTPQFEFTGYGTYVVQLIVNDGVDDSAPDTVVITSDNAAPVAVAGDDVEVPKNTLVPLDGSASFDPNNDPLTYTWTIISAPAGSTAVLTDPTSVTPSITPDIDGIYVIELVVNDGNLDSEPDTLTITALNAPPIADAGVDQIINAIEPVQLDGSGSSDPDGDPLTYIWTVIETPDGQTATLSDPTAVMPELEFSGYGTYTIQLIVNDGVTDSAPDTVVITPDNAAPVAVAGDDVEAPQNTLVPLDGSASFDPNNDPITYTWTLVSAPAGSTAVLIDPTSVTPSITPDVKGTYVIELVVNDGILDSAPDTLTITALNEPPIADAGPDQVVDAVSVDVPTMPPSIPLVYANTGASLYEVDPVSRTTTLVGDFDGCGSSVTDIALDANGSAVVSTSGGLYRVDVSNARCTLIAEGSYPVSLSFVPAGLVGNTEEVLMGLAGSTLIQIDPVTGDIQEIGDLEGGYRASGDIVSVEGAGTFVTVTNAAEGCRDCLLQIDPANGTIVRNFGRLGYASVWGLAYWGGSLYGFTSGSQLFEIILQGNDSVDTNLLPLSDMGFIPFWGAASSTQAPLTVPTPQTGVQLDGSGSSDPDGDPLTYEWVILEVPEGETASLSDPTVVMPVLQVSGPGEYVIQLVVNDGTVDSAPDTVVITFENSPPLAIAGPDQTVLVGDTASLDGSNSVDPDGDALTYRWEIVSRPDGSTVALLDPTSVTPQFTPDAEGEFVIQLIVNDGTLDSAPDTAVITAVIANEPPVADAGDDQVIGTTPGVTAGELLVYAHTEDELYKVDPTTLEVTLVGEFDNCSRVMDMAIDADGNAFLTTNVRALGSTKPANHIPGLYRLDLETASCTLVAEDPRGFTIAGALTFVPAGVLYPDREVLVGGRHRGRAGNLIEIDTVTGETTIISQFSENVITNGRDIVSVAGLGTFVSVMGSRSLDDPNYYCDNCLLQVDPVTGEVLQNFGEHTSGARAMYGLAYWGGRFYAFGHVLSEIVLQDDGTMSITEIPLPDENLVFSGASTSTIAPLTFDASQTRVRLDGSGSFDPNNDPLTYTWRVVETPAGETAELANENGVRPVLTVSGSGEYVVELVVNDGLVDSAPDTVTITFENGAPVADAGLDNAATAGDVINLDGSGSFDPDDDPITYQWEIVQRPAGSTATLLDAESVNPQFTPDVGGEFVIQLIVNDGMLDSAPDTVTITAIVLNEPPVADAGDDQVIGTTPGVTAGELLVYAHTEDTLYKVDPTTLEVTLVGEFDNCSRVSDMAIDADGNAFLTTNVRALGSTKPANHIAGLYRLDLETASCTLVAEGPVVVSGSSGVSITGALTFVPAGVLHPDREALVGARHRGSAGDLIEINPETGEFTIISQFSENVITNGRDIVSVAGLGTFVSVMGSRSLDNPNYYCDNCLLQVDPVTGEVLQDFGEHISGTRAMSGLAYWGGRFYAFGDVLSEIVLQDDGTMSITEIPLPDENLVFRGASTSTIAPLTFDASQTRVRLDGSGSFDPNNDPLTYTWRVVETPTGETAELANENGARPVLTVSGPGEYVVELVVNDGLVDSAPDTVTITFENGAPVADAGLDNAAAAGDVINLDGSGSFDPDDDPITYQWEIVQRPAGSTATLLDAESVNPQFTPDIGGEFVIQLIVNDGLLDSAPDIVTITAENRPPIADAGPDQVINDDSEFVPSRPGDTLLYAHNQTELYRIDPTTGTSTLIGLLENCRINDLAIDANGRAIGTTLGNDLVEVDLTNAECTLIREGIRTNALSFLPVGTASPDREVLMGANTNIITIDPVTGDIQTLGELGEGLFSSGDIASVEGVGTFSTAISRTGGLNCFDCLLQIDPVSGEVLQNLGSVGVRQIQGLAYWGGSLYGFSEEQGMFEIIFEEDGSLSTEQIALSGGLISFNGAATSTKAPLTVPPRDSARLDGSNSSDPNGDPLTYEWVVIETPAGETATLSDPTAEMPVLTVSGNGDYVVQLIVNDGSVDSAPDTVTITFESAVMPNDPPVADAGPDQTVDSITIPDLPTGGPLVYAHSLTTADGITSLYEVDPISKITTLVGELEGCQGSVTDIALDGNGLAVVSSTQGLYRVDLTTARCTLIAAGRYPVSLTFLPVGTVGNTEEVLLGLSIFTFILIDPITGAIEEISTLEGGYYSSGDLVSIEGVGTFATVFQGPENCGDCLLQVDPTNGSIVRNYGDIGFEKVLGLAYWGGSLYGFSGDEATGGEQLFEIILNDDGTLETKVLPLVEPIFFGGAASSTLAPLTIPTSKTGVRLDGSGSFDPDDDPLSYTWIVTETPEGETASLSNANAVRPVLSVSGPGEYVVELVVNDGLVDSTPDTVTIIFENSLPRASAGNDLTVLVGDTANLDGSGSVDPDGDPLTYRWEIISRPNGSSADLVDPTDVAPQLTPDAEGEFVVQLIVNDGLLDSPPDTVVITAVEANESPFADAGDDRIINALSTDEEEFLVYAHTGEELYKVDPNTLEVTLVGEFDNCSRVIDMAIDADGNAFLTTNVRSSIENKPANHVPGLYRLDLETASCTLIVESENAIAGALTFLPAGVVYPDRETLVASSHDRGPGFLSIIDTETGGATELTRFSEEVITNGRDIVSVVGLGTFMSVMDSALPGEPEYCSTCLVQVNPITGEILQNFGDHPSGRSSMFGLAYWGGRFYGFGYGITAMVLEDDGTMTVTEVAAPDENMIFQGAATSTTAPLTSSANQTRARLDGRGSFDPNDDSLTYTWTVSEIPPGETAELINANGTRPVLTVSGPGEYVVQLVVNDGLVDSVPDTVTVIFEDSLSSASAGPDQTVLVGDAANLDGSGSVNPNGDPLTYRWEIISRPDGSSADLVDPTDVAPQLTPDAEGEFVVQLIVNDGLLDSPPDTVVITAVEANESPFADAGEDRIFDALSTTDEEEFLVYAHTAEELYKVDPNTLEVTLVGKFDNCSRVIDMAIDADGNAFLTTNVRSSIENKPANHVPGLYRLDLETASCTLIVESENAIAGALTFLPAGVVYPDRETLVASSHDRGPGFLSIIDTETGGATELTRFSEEVFADTRDIVSAVGLGTFMSVTASSPRSGPKYCTTCLVQVNPITGEILQNFGDHPSGNTSMYGLAYWGGRFYAFGYGISSIVLEDDGTMTVTEIAAPDDNMFFAGAATSTTAPLTSGANQTRARLDGRGSFDPDGDSLTYTWTVSEIPPGETAELINANGTRPVLTVSGPGEYVVQLVVNDDLADSVADTVTVIFED